MKGETSEKKKKHPSFNLAMVAHSKIIIPYVAAAATTGGKKSAAGTGGHAPMSISSSNDRVVLVLVSEPSWSVIAL